MRTIFGLIIALALGVSLVALGVSIFTYGLGQPITCNGSTHYGGCGNLPLIAGVFITAAGLVTLGGGIAYAMKVWEHSDSELASD